MAAFLTPRRTHPDTSALTALVWLLMAEANGERPALSEETEEDSDRTIMNYPGAPDSPEAEPGGGDDGASSGTEDEEMEAEEEPRQGLSGKVWALVGTVCLVAVLFIGFVGYSYMRARSHTGSTAHTAMQQNRQPNVASAHHHSLSTQAGSPAPAQSKPSQASAKPQSPKTALSTPKLAVQSANTNQASGAATPPASSTAGGAQSMPKLATNNAAAQQGAAKRAHPVAVNAKAHARNANNAKGAGTQQSMQASAQSPQHAASAPSSAQWKKLNHKLASIQSGIQALQKRMSHEHHAPTQADADKLASLKKKVATLEKDKGKLAAENKKLHGVVHWLKTVRHRLKAKIAAAHKPAYPDWHVIGFGQHSAVIAGPGQKTKVVRVGSHVFGAKVTKIDAQHGKVVTSHGVFTEAG